ncbi:AAA family ATPase [Acidicapsa dinghuensis]|uniref:AAA family ATPase n=1 Tax=Acidicapsa dinghuensis TaxID=2218256 RepID=A0ABW1ED90_9BACT|nr:AAA family ATPase [Acidicapsa dinghuensis]
MPTSPARNGRLLEYAAHVDREEELERLLAQAKARKSLLVFGPQGVGKTRLLQKFIQHEPLALYVPQMRSPSELLHSLLDALRSADPRIKLPANVSGLSSSSLKGIIHRALDTKPFQMVLDHLEGPSRVATGVVKDLHYLGRTPVIFAARSPHMEDIGTLQPLCALKSERLEIKNWPHHIALEFAQREAEKDEISAANIGSILPSLVEWSDGNPGAIVQMLKMARLPQYQVGDQIKAHILYLDYRMGRY